MAEGGDRRARRLVGRLRDLSFELSGAQLGITISSLALGAVAEPTVAQVISPVLGAVGLDSPATAVAVALVLATLAQMVAGELFPKNVAIARPYPTAIRIGLPMAFANRLMRPLIVMFNKSANWTVRRLGIEPRDELVGLRSMQELAIIVRASGSEGELEEYETSLLTRAITFSEREAADAMVPRVDVEAVSAETTVNELRTRSVETGHSRFPVYEEDVDSIVGIAYIKDTFAVPPERRDEATARAIAVEAQLVPESVGLDTLLIDLQTAGKTMAVVVDEYGGTAGIITVEDIVEELLGEIADEHDVDQEPAGEGEWISGRLHRHEVAERTGFEWPEGRYETLSGYLTAALHRFPEPGDKVREGGYVLEVIDVVDRVADRIKVGRADSRAVET